MQRALGQLVRQFSIRDVYAVVWTVSCAELGDAMHVVPMKIEMFAFILDIFVETGNGEPNENDRTRYAFLYFS